MDGVVRTKKPGSWGAFGVQTKDAKWSMVVSMVVQREKRKTLLVLVVQREEMPLVFKVQIQVLSIVGSQIEKKVTPSLQT